MLVGIPFFDVFGDFRQLPVRKIARMYIPEAQSGPNHLNDQGNAFVAALIYEKLSRQPWIAEILSPGAHVR